MRYLDSYEKKLMKTFNLSALKFIFIAYALMCTWSNLTHNLIMSISITIDDFLGIDLSFIYSYAEMIETSDILMLIATAPFVETLIFQSLIQNIFRKITKSVLLSVCITAILFSLVHLGNNVANAVNALGLGITFAMTYEYFRMKRGHFIATVVTIALHAFWNLTCVYSLFPFKIFI